MLLLAAHHLRGAVVVDITGAEERFGIIGTVRCKLLQVVVQFLCDILEVDDCIDIEGCFRLLGQDMFGDIFLETATELRDILDFQGETNGIGMTAEVLEQIATALDGVVEVVASHTSGRARGQTVMFGEYHRRTVIQFRQT